MNCYFCGKKLLETIPAICERHDPVKNIYHWPDRGGICNQVQFSVLHNEKAYKAVYFITEKKLCVEKIKEDGINIEVVYLSNELLDLTPENILKKLPTILTFA